MKMADLKIKRSTMFISLILVVINLLTLSSCCTKKYCLGADDMDQIYFYNVVKENLDTVVVRKFAKNTDFSTLISSTTTTVTANVSNADFEIVILKEKLTVDFDYKVELPGNGQVFTISDFVVKKEQCNSGFMCNDYFNALESYKVNGKLASGAILALGK